MVAAVVTGVSGYLSGYPPSAVWELEIVDVGAVVGREALDCLEAVPRVDRFALYFFIWGRNVCEEKLLHKVDSLCQDGG